MILVKIAGAAKTMRLANLRILTAIFCAAIGPVATAEVRPSTCIDDAMLIVDASGSMLGIDEGGSDRLTTRIDDARTALAGALPHVTPYRRIGLMSYGPGGHCKTSLHLRPEPNAAAKILAEVSHITPDGLTPLTSAVAQAADVLDYRSKPALIVLLTDGEETCDGDPCGLAGELKATGQAITVHVIGYRMQDLISTREKGIADMKCLAAETGGRFISVDKINELIAALNTTLGCPMTSEAKPNDDSLALITDKNRGIPSSPE